MSAALLAALVGLASPFAPTGGQGHRQPSGAGGRVGALAAHLALDSAIAARRSSGGARAGARPTAAGAIPAAAVALPDVLSSGLRKRAARPGIALERSASEPYWACPKGLCEAIVDPPAVRSAGRWRLPAGTAALPGSGEKGGYDPADLRAAYAIPEGGGEGQTIALIDAYGYPEAEADLAHYRERYGLPPCTHANGCFAKVNQTGEEGSYPAANKGWEGESALDLDMASAACPHCHLLLVEAKSASFEELGAAVDTAVRLGASEVSNSYGIAEQECGAGGCVALDSYYEHPGVLISASAGDAGYDNVYEKDESPSFPASSPGVIAVGGTALKRAENGRGFSEAVWSEPSRSLGSGSGCSSSQPKPAWQHDAACPHRMDNDTAAVAACETPLSVYVSAYGGWEDFCGTSAASPLFAGIEAHASAYARSLGGAQALYQEVGGFFDVSVGSNGSCTPPAEDAYFCTALVGYDGPTGLGAPDGPLALQPAPSVSALGSGEVPAAGGEQITLEGAHLTRIEAVKVGSASAPSFTLSSESKLSFVAPAGSGCQPVVVKGAYGESAAASAPTLCYGPTYGFGGAFGNGYLEEPSGLAVAPGGEVWALSAAESRIEEFTAAGERLGGFGSTLFDPFENDSCSAQMCTPSALAVNAEGDLWVAEWLEQRVREYRPSGAVVRTIGGTLGSAPGQFEFPTGVAVDSKGDVYVADAGNGRIQEFSDEGALIRAFGSPGSGEGQLQWPTGLALAPEGNLLVADSGSDRLELCDTSAEGPVSCRAFAAAALGYGEGALMRPEALAIANNPNDASGWYLLVGDSGPSRARVAIFNQAGEYVGQAGSFGHGAGELGAIGGIALGAAGTLYVSDPPSTTIATFTLGG